MTHLTTVFHTPSWSLAGLHDMAQQSQNLLFHPFPTNSWVDQFVFLTTVEQSSQCFHNINYNSPGTAALTGNAQLRAKHFIQVSIAFVHVYPRVFVHIESHVFLPSHYALKGPSRILPTRPDFLLPPKV